MRPLAVAGTDGIGAVPTVAQFAGLALVIGLAWVVYQEA